MERNRRQILLERKAQTCDLHAFLGPDLYACPANSEGSHVLSLQLLLRLLLL